MKRDPVFALFFFFLPLGAALFGAVGCQSTPVVDGVPVGNAMAAVSVRGVGVGKLRDAIFTTFRAADYSPERSLPGELVFDRRGSRSKQIQYGSYMGGAMYDRIKLRIDSPSPSEHIVKGDLFVVTNKGSMTGDDERPVLRFGIDELQGLLNQVKTRAEAPAAW